VNYPFNLYGYTNSNTRAMQLGSTVAHCQLKSAQYFRHLLDFAVDAVQNGLFHADILKML